jgi:hypothetical protein
MIKRRWFSTLTDFNVEQFFHRAPPSIFINFLRLVYEAFDAEVEQCGPDSDPNSLKCLMKTGRVELIFKGGNSVGLIKGIARTLLPEAVQRTLKQMTPTGLSDLDFMAQINYLDDPWLSDEANFNAIHQQLRAVSVRALTAVVDAVEYGMMINAPEFQSFRQMLVDFDREQLSDRLRNLLSGSIAKLKGEIQTALGDADGSSEDMKPVYALLDTFRLEDAEVLPGQRESIAIHNNLGSEVEISIHGEPRHIYVSDNPDIIFKDIRCVESDDECSFSLVRALVGYNVEARVNLPEELKDEVEFDFHRFSKGEGIDISIPRTHDIAFKMLLKAQIENEKMRPRVATLTSGSAKAVFPMESLDSLILEQRDLSFGRRMQSVLIWRIGKVTKRLGRLLELCCIKALSLPQFSWARKAKAFVHLAQRLERFASVSLPRLFEGAAEEAATDATPPAKRRRTSAVPAGASPSEDVADRRHAWTELKRDAGVEVDEVLEGAWVNAMLLKSLDDLALKVFSDVKKRDLPANFVEKWREILAPMIQTSKDFAVAYDQLHAFHSLGAAPAYYAEESFYMLDFAESWGKVFNLPTPWAPDDESH